MSSKKKFGFKLPINPKTLLDTIGFADQSSSQELMISLLIDNSLDSTFLSYIKKAMRPLNNFTTIEVIPYFEDPCDVAATSDLIIIFAAKAPATGRLVNHALIAQLPVVVVTLDADLVMSTAREHYNELDLSLVVTTDTLDPILDLDCNLDALDASARAAQISKLADLTIARYDALFERLGAWMVRRMDDKRLSLARSLAFVRAPYADDVILATSLQNAAISAAFFLPGADMPLLTLNQAKMFLQIAAAYGVQIDKGRIKELAIIAASGFGFRAIARKLVGLIPVFGWAVRGVVGCSATLGLGYLVKAHFSSGGDCAALISMLKEKAGLKGQS